MTASIFLKELRMLKPQIEVSESVNEGMVTFFQKGFDIPIIEPRTAYHNNEIENLCLNYLDEDLIIGAATIFSNVIIHDDFRIFGSVEANPLAFSHQNELFEINHEDFSLGSTVAKDDKAFLSAFLIYAELMKGRFEDIYNLQDTETNKTFAERCSNAAGGSEYYHFYAFLIGYC